MKTLNQIVTVLLLVLLLVLLPIVATIPDAVLNAIQAATFSIEPWVMTSMGRLITGAVAAVLWLLVIWALWREVRGSGDRSIRVTEVQEGTARVAETSVAKLIETRLSSVPDVKTASAKVRQTKDGVMVDLGLTTVGGVRVPDVTRAAIDVARTTVESESGAKVERVDVRVREVGRTEGMVMAWIPSTPGLASMPSVPAQPAPEAPSWPDLPPEPVIIPEPDEPEWQAPRSEVTRDEWATEATEPMYSEVESVWTHEESPLARPEAEPDALAVLAAEDEPACGPSDFAFAEMGEIPPDSVLELEDEANWDEAEDSDDAALPNDRAAGQA